MKTILANLIISPMTIRPPTKKITFVWSSYIKGGKYMIATIISVVVILPVIIWLIVGLLKKNLDREDFDIMSCIVLGSCLLLFVSLGIGYKKGDPVRKVSIEEALNLGSKFAIRDATEYNDDVRKGDNYFCRFTLRLGSDYIDVTFYEINKEDKDDTELRWLVYDNGRKS